MKTDHVLVFDNTAPQAYARFINWISQSIQSQSRSVSTGGETRVSLAKGDADLLADRQIAPALTSHDDRFAVFIARCAERSAPYIVKYERHLNRIDTTDPALAQMFQTRIYALVMAVPVKNSYFEMSDSQSGAQSVSSADLIGQPACPHCQARFGMAVCACGGVDCVEGDGDSVCPCCKRTATYTSSSDGAGFDINRGRG